jgi:hypothetical protein
MVYIFYLVSILIYSISTINAFNLHKTLCSKNNIIRSLSMVDQLGRVTMYKKVGCPHCEKAIDLLERKYKLNVIYVDINSDKRYIFILLCFVVSNVL